MNRYRATSPYGEAIWGKDEFDADFTATDERDHLDGGHLEIVPRNYTVMSDNFSGGPKGAVYQGALRKEIEDALMSGGHIQRAGEDGGESTFAGQTAAGGKGGEPVEDPADPDVDDEAL